MRKPVTFFKNVTGFFIMLFFKNVEKLFPLQNVMKKIV